MRGSPSEQQLNENSLKIWKYRNINCSLTAQKAEGLLLSMNPNLTQVQGPHMSSKVPRRVWVPCTVGEIAQA